MAACKGRCGAKSAFAIPRRLPASNWQELVELFFNSNEAALFRKSWHRLTALPDAYNYKVGSLDVPA